MKFHFPLAPMIKKTEKMRLSPLVHRQSHCLCLQIVWQLSQRRKAAGVLGSPERYFVAQGQARTKTVLANV